MKTIIRTLPALIAAYLLGVYIEDPSTAQATYKVTTAAGILAAGFVVWLFLCFVTRSRPQQEQQSGSWYRPTRARTGRN